MIEGNATDLLQLLPERTIGNIETIVSSIPMVNLRLSDQQQIVTAVKNVMKINGKLLQFTYRPGSPLPSNKLGLDQRYLGPAPFAFKDHFKFKRASL